MKCCEPAISSLITKKFNSDPRPADKQAAVVQDEVKVQPKAFPKSKVNMNKKPRHNNQ